MFRLVFLHSGVLDDFRDRTSVCQLTKPGKIEGAQAKVGFPCVAPTLAGNRGTECWKQRIHSEYQSNDTKNPSYSLSSYSDSCRPSVPFFFVVT
jgi:hypothetical protein